MYKVMAHSECFKDKIYKYDRTDDWYKHKDKNGAL